MPFQKLHKKSGYIYILSNRQRNVFYVGVTSNLKRRIWQHKQGQGSIFTNKYRVKYLMHYEVYENIQLAINREKQLKNWLHDWKLELIKKNNPAMKDLWDSIY